jgi:hypothetical protein
MSGKATFAMSVIREALRKHAEATSLHVAAEDVGLSYTGLRGFLGGGKPHPRTREKLVDWYVHIRDLKPTNRSAIATEDVDAAVSLLQRYIAADGREALCERRARDLAKRLFEDGARHS